MDLTRRGLLLAAGALAVAPRGLVHAGLQRRAEGRRLIVVMCDGGWDTSFAYDPKFHSPEIDGPWVDENLDNPDDREALRTFGELAIATNDFKRPAVTQFFEQWHDRLAVLNGIWIGALAHPPCRLRILTGSDNMADAAVSSIVGAGVGQDLPLGTIDLSGMAFTGPLAASSGQVGYQNQLKLLVKDDANFRPPEGSGLVYPQFSPTEHDRTALFEHLRARNEVMLGVHRDARDNVRKYADRLESLVRADRFRTMGASALDELRLGSAPSLVEQGDLAIEFLKRDLCATVTLNSTHFWDTHANNHMQHGYWQSLFVGLSHIAERLSAEQMLDDTMIAVVSEMTRTPRINARAGKDHWPHASVLLFGGGVQGGRAYGATDDRGESLPVDYLTGERDPAGAIVRFDNFAAGLTQALGVDPGPWFPGVEPYLPYMTDA